MTAGLTGRTRVRIDWLGLVRLQVESRSVHIGRCHVPPKIDQPDTRPTYMVWRDALQVDLLSFEPPFVTKARR